MGEKIEMKRVLIRPRLEGQFGNDFFTYEIKEYPAFYGTGWTVALREVLREKGYQLETVDMAETIDDFCNADKIIFMGYYKDKYFEQCLDHGLKDKMVYYEVEFPSSNNLELTSSMDGNYAPSSYLKEFGRVLTWNKDLVDNKRVFYMQRPNNWYKKLLLEIPFRERNLLVLASSNKSGNIDGELYSEREKAVEFFQDEIPGQFDLYGRGWSKSISRYVKRRLGFTVSDYTKSSWLATKLVGEKNHSKCLKGWTTNIYESYSKYRFALVYENLGGYRGSVSNRIFDCLQAGCVPIYLGASDIEEIVPKGCFIDKREFDYERLLKLIENMGEERWASILEMGKMFLVSPQGKRHFEKDWATDFTEVLLR